MNERALQISWCVVVLIGAVQIVIFVWRRAQRRRLALRVNQSLTTAPPPSVSGEWRDTCCAALLGAAWGESVGLCVRPLPRWLALRLGKNMDITRRRAWQPFWKPGRYAIATQLMLAAARAIESDGQLNMRRYKLELAFLHRYAIHPSRAVASTAKRLRAQKDNPGLASRISLSAEVALVGVPVGLVWREYPEQAARLAAQLAAQTHARKEVHQAAALVAVAVAHHATSDPEQALKRRQLLEHITASAGGPEGAAAISLKPTPDLAARPLEENLQRLRSGMRVLDLLPVAFYLALRFDKAPREMLETIPRLGRQAPIAAAIAAALVALRTGRQGIEGLPLRDVLQDREALEILGEKLSVIVPEL